MALDNVRQTDRSRTVQIRRVCLRTRGRQGRGHKGHMSVESERYVCIREAGRVRAPRSRASTVNQQETETSPRPGSHECMSEPGSVPTSLQR